MHDPRRILDLPALLNARDLGGYPTLDGARTRWRSLVRADDLVQLTAAGVRGIRTFGIETVLDLRWPEEVSAHPSPIARDLVHVRYEHVSLLAPAEAEWRALEAGCTKEMWKCAVLDHTRAELGQVLRTIAAASPGPLLFHCMAGKDRTGVVAALLLALGDVVPEAIAYDYAASAEQLREGYLRRYADMDPAVILEALRCPEEGVYNMLDYLERHGGIRAYLERIGLEAGEIERLRGRVRE